MAIDADLADRVRRALAHRNPREKTMFGGLAFMVDDNLVLSVGDGLLVRVPNERDAEYCECPGARRAEMGTGRSMGEGWITVDADALTTDEGLQFWIDAVLWR